MEVRHFVERLKKSGLTLDVKGPDLVLKGPKEQLSSDKQELIKQNKELIDYIRANKKELIEFLSSDRLSDSANKHVPPVSAIYPLSPLQEGLLFHGLYDQGSPAYLQQLTCRFTNVQVELLEASWEQLLRNHTILRTSFHYKELSVPVQCVHQIVHLPIMQLDYRTYSEQEQRVHIEAFLAADKSRGVDFTQPPLMRLTLIRLSDAEHQMVWTYHHLLLDGWSMPVLMFKLLTTYELLSQGGKVPDTQEDRYEDFIRYHERMDKQAAEKFWKRYLAGLDGTSLLPLVKTRSDDNGWPIRNRHVRLTLDAADTQTVQTYAQTNRLTVNTIMQGVWAYLLAKYSGRTDVIFGVTVSGRPVDLPNAEQRVGLYINTLPFRASLSEEQPVVGWLTTLQEEHSHAREYSYSPLTTIQTWAGVKGEWFNSLYVFENYPLGEVFSQRWQLQAGDLRTDEQTNYPLSIVVTAGRQLIVDFGYDGDLLTPATVQRLQGHFRNVLRQIVSDPNLRLGQLELVTEEERHQLLVDFNNTSAPYPHDKTIVELFELQAGHTPDKIAIVFHEKVLTYHQLNEKADQLANYLRAKGTKHESVLPIFADRSLELIIGLLGILKAGAAYLPIDPDYPAERIAYMLEDSGASYAITTSAHVAKLAELEQSNTGIKLICLDRDWPLVEQEPQAKVAIVRPHQLAYVMYTSGSTGNLKA